MSIIHYPDADDAPKEPVIAGFRHWRIDVKGTSGGIYFSCSLTEFREIVGAPQQATGGVSSARTVYGAGYEADKAFDNNPSTAYNSAAGDAATAWLRYSFATERDVREVAIAPFPSAAGPPQSPTAFDLMRSFDGTSWTLVKSFTGITGWAAGVTKTFTV